MNLEPTYKFVLEADIVRIVLFLLIVFVVGFGVLLHKAMKLREKGMIAEADARDAKEKAKQSELELEEIRLKMVGELTNQISQLTQRISADREQDRLIREKELKAVDELVKSVDNTTNLLKDHTENSLVFRTTMTTQSTTMLTLIGDANKGIADNTTAIHSVKTELDEFKQALIALPNTIQAILNPYCERMESALQKLETVQVEEKHNYVHAEEIDKRSSVGADVLDVHPVDIHPSDTAETRAGGSTQPVPSGDGEGSDPSGGVIQVTDEDANRNTTAKSDTGDDRDATSG